MKDTGLGRNTMVKSLQRFQITKYLQNQLDYQHNLSSNSRANETTETRQNQLY